jgi:hypothetical protein
LAGVKVYMLAPIEDFEGIGPVDIDDMKRFRTLDGTPQRDRWTPVRMELISQDAYGGTQKRANVPWMTSTTLFLRDEAIKTAGPILQRYGELLPVDCDGADVVTFNAGQVLDVLDEKRSEIRRFRSGRLMGIDTYVFHGEIPERAAFKLPQQPRGPIFYTEAVVDELNTLALTGLDWTLVWDSTRKSTHPT